MTLVYNLILSETVFGKIISKAILNLRWANKSFYFFGNKIKLEQYCDKGQSHIKIMSKLIQSKIKYVTRNFEPLLIYNATT